MHHARKLDRAIAASREQREDRRIGQRTDLVKHFRAPLHEECFELPERNVGAVPNFPSPKVCCERRPTPSNMA